MKRFLLVFFGIVVFTSISFLILLYINSFTFVWMWSVWLAVLVVIIIKARSHRTKLVTIYAASALFAVFLAEVYFSGLLGFRYERIHYEHQLYQGAYIQQHEVLGRALVPGSKWWIKYAYGDSLSYDIVQSVDANGLRLTLGEHEPEAAPVLFMGCSFTFGHGLSDHETIASFFQQSNKHLEAINMGQSGFGIHQTLAIFENGLEESHIEEKQPKAAFYSALTDHTFRGKNALIGDFGPKYELNKNNEPEFQGLLSHRLCSLSELLEKSHLLTRYVLRRRPSTEADIDLLAIMIEKSARLFSDRYDAPFYCLLWEEPYAEEGLYDKLLEKLKARNIKVIEVADMLPGYDKNPWQYFLYKDIHPNALANKLIGEYLSELLDEQENEIESPENP